MPKSTPATTASATVKANTRQSSGVSPRLFGSSRRPHSATTVPAPALTSASSTLLVRSWRTSRNRVAPIDRRTDSSFCREKARDSSRFATLAHTNRRISPTTTLSIAIPRTCVRGAS